MSFLLFGSYVEKWKHKSIRPTQNADADQDKVQMLTDRRSDAISHERRSDTLRTDQMVYDEVMRADVVYDNDDEVLRVSREYKDGDSID